jgi:hypothetical protein
MAVSPKIYFVESSKTVLNKKNEKLKIRLYPELFYFVNIKQQKTDLQKIP